MSPPASSSSDTRSATGGPDDAAFSNPAIFAAILQQNWENVRTIKSQRIWFLNTFAVVNAGTQSFLLSARRAPLLQNALDLSMCAFAVMGLLISLRLKAELEECLAKLQTMVERAHVDEFMALERSEGALSRYPQFRWMFPVFYFFAIVLAAAQFAYRVISR